MKILKNQQQKISRPRLRRAGGLMINNSSGEEYQQLIVILTLTLYSSYTLLASGSKRSLQQMKSVPVIRHHTTDRHTAR